MFLLYAVLFFILILSMLFITQPLWRQYKPLIVGTLLSSSVISLLLYQQLGDAPGYQKLLAQAQTKIELAKAREIMKTPEQVIARLQQRLAAEPNSARGWYLLGRLYVTTHDYDQALPAFQKAVALDKNNVEYLFNLVQALYWREGQQRNLQINNLIHHILALDNNYLPIHLFIAADAAGHNDHTIAIKHWQLVLEHLPVGSDEHSQVLKLIAHSQKILAS